MSPPITKRFHRLTLVVRVGLGLVLIYSSAAKIADPDSFATIVVNYRLLPQPLVWATAVFLPWIEAICGLSLLCGYLEKGAALLASLMMVVFIAVTLYNASRGLSVACGCFSLAVDESSNVYVNTVRNLSMLAAGLWVLIVPRRPGRLHAAV